MTYDIKGKKKQIIDFKREEIPIRFHVDYLKVNEIELNYLKDEVIDVFIVQKGQSLVFLPHDKKFDSLINRRFRKYDDLKVFVRKIKYNARGVCVYIPTELVKKHFPNADTIIYKCDVVNDKKCIIAKFVNKNN